MADGYGNWNLGNNANPGDIIAPKRGLSDSGGLYSMSVNPGQTYFTARDSTWPKQRHFPNAGNSGAFVTIDEYGAGSERPTIDWDFDEPGAFTGIFQSAGWNEVRNQRIVNVGPAINNHSDIGSDAFRAEFVDATRLFNCYSSHTSECVVFLQRCDNGNARVEGCYGGLSCLRWHSTSGVFGAALAVVRVPHINFPGGATVALVDNVIDRCAGEAWSVHEIRGAQMAGGVVFAAISAACYLTAAADCTWERTIAYGTDDSLWHRTSGWVGYGYGTTVEGPTSNAIAASHGNNRFKLGLVAFCQNGFLLDSGGHASVPDHVLKVDHFVFVDNQMTWQFFDQLADLLAGSTIHGNVCICYTTANSEHWNGDGSQPQGTFDANYSMWVGNLGTRPSDLLGANDTATTPLIKTTGWQAITDIDDLGVDLDPLDDVLNLGRDIAHNFAPLNKITSVQSLANPALDWYGVSGLDNPGAIKHGEDAPPIPPGDQAWRVERHVVTLGASSDSTTLNYTTAGKNAASVVPRITNTRLASAGPVAGSASQETLATLGARLESLTASGCSVVRHSAGNNVDVRVDIEVWFYDGAAGGADEFIVRESGTKTITDTNASTTEAIGGVSNAADCVAICLGSTSDTAGGYGHFCRLYLGDGASSPDATLTLSREDDVGDLAVGYLVVEFTGSNWTVRQATNTFGAWNTTETETISSITDWAQTFLLSSMECGDDESAEIGCLVWPGSSATEIRFRMNSSSGSGSLGVVTAFAVRNANLVVDHLDTVTGGSSALATTSNPGTQSITVPSVADIDYAGVIMHATHNEPEYDASPDGFVGYRLASATSIGTWRSRGDTNTLQWAAQVVDFFGLTIGAAQPVSHTGLLLLGIG